MVAQLFSELVSFTSITQQTVVLSTGGIPVNTQFALELQANESYSFNQHTLFQVDSNSELMLFRIDD